jgi:probable phosphoglycerate mutase
MTALSFLYMRHGRTHANEQGLCSGGHCPTRLTPAGRDRIAQSARELKAQNIIPESIWLSPTVRTRETAAIVMDVLGLPPGIAREEPEWRERHYGAWEGKSYEPLIEELQNGAVGDGGESIPVFQERIRRAVALLAEELRRREAATAPLLLIAHGYVWQGLHDIHLRADDAAEVPWISNGDIYAMKIAGQTLSRRKIAGAAETELL